MRLLILLLLFTTSVYASDWKVFISGSKCVNKTFEVNNNRHLIKPMDNFECVISKTAFLVADDRTFLSRMLMCRVGNGPYFENGVIEQEDYYAATLMLIEKEGIPASCSVTLFKDK